MYIFVGGRGGGLEHVNSTTIGVTRETLARNPRAAETVSAHEFFHTWNVKRIRPIEATSRSRFASGPAVTSGCAQLRELPTQTDRMRRIRAGLLRGRDDEQ